MKLGCAFGLSFCERDSVFDVVWYNFEVEGEEFFVERTGFFEDGGKEFLEVGGKEFFEDRGKELSWSW